MARLDDLTRGASLQGIPPDGLVTVIDVKWHGSTVVELTYKDAAGRLGNELLYRDDEPHHPFRREPDFGVTSVDYDLAELLAKSEAPE